MSNHSKSTPTTLRPSRHKPRTTAQTQPRQRTSEQLAGARPPLPPGAAWALLTAGTCLDGVAYPGGRAS